MTKYADDKPEWKISPVWTNIVILTLLTIAVIVVPWYTGWLLLWMFGGILLVFLWYHVLFVTDGDYILFDKSGITINEEGDKYFIGWKEFDSLSFDWYWYQTGHRYHDRLPATRLIFQSQDKDKFVIPVPVVLWPRILFGIGKINKIAGKDVMVERGLLASLVKTMGKIIGVVLLFLIELIALYGVSESYKSRNWIMLLLCAIIAAVLGYILYSKIHIPDKYE